MSSSIRNYKISMYEKVQDNNPTTKLTNKTYGYITVELIHVVAVDIAKQSKTRELLF